MSLPPNRNLLKEYPNRILVESGSYRGDAIQQALDAGYSEVRSIDIDHENTHFCRLRFDLFPHPAHTMLPIKLYTGDSAVMLWDMIKDIHEPVTFWLDAHSQLFEDEPPMDHPFPLLMELEQIARHSVKMHTILIDDILVLTHADVTGWTRYTIENLIYRINPDYNISYVANPVKNNLLIATI